MHLRIYPHASGCGATSQHGAKALMDPSRTWLPSSVFLTGTLTYSRLPPSIRRIGMLGKQNSFFCYLGPMGKSNPSNEHLLARQAPRVPIVRGRIGRAALHGNRRARRLSTRRRSGEEADVHDRQGHHNMTAKEAW